MTYIAIHGTILPLTFAALCIYASVKILQRSMK